ncbi:viral A-type inclusion protein [Trypanosoma rangeli]|uniref:Centrosomal protein of 162 kDa n=1 Tax=Trypanosoma rangeli TaxID=5698 RepID=A0A422NPG5_TRYRA|nr:viral A-type inclusion protein [Trypanosoma rangeli]RNF07279.1 viral A-type inclusion protein [Trypanosoma rangeli]|eukprot:RNF07279.1 viral A-type inclusion protein [Trypanosoma rangeli]
MTEDPVEDVRRYLARDEVSAKQQFTTSLQGKSSEELVALLRSRREANDADEAESMLSGDNCSAVVVKSESGIKNTPPAARKLQVEDVASSLTGTERLVEISRVDTSRDEPLTQLKGNESQRSLQEEYSVAWKAVRSGVMVTKEELEEVQQEMLLQERVLKALERDNAEVHAERRLLRAKLAEMEQKAVNVEAKYSILASSQSPNPHAGQPLPSAATTSTQSGQRGCQDELHMELEQQKTMVRELQLELELLGREKKELETRLAALDVKKFGEMELELRNLRVDLKRKETEHNGTVKDMARKIAWYVEHQEFNRSQEELLKEQQDTICRLRARLHEMGAMDDTGRHKRVGKDARVKYLTKRVVELEEALNQKHPDSIAQLIRSCQPSVQDSKQFKQLNLRIKELEEAIVEKDRCAEAAVARLRVETDRLRIQYQEKIERLEEELKIRLMHAQTRRVCELEKQLAEARQALRERDQEGKSFVAAVERPVAADRCLPGKDAAALDEPEESKACMTATQTGAVNHVGEAISLLQKENEALKSQLSQTTQAVTQTPAAVAASPDSEGKTFPLHVISSMQAQLSTLTAELAVYKQLLTESQGSLRDAHARWEERLLTARQEYQYQLQHVRQEHNEDIKRIQENHQREMKAIAEQQQALEAASWACQKAPQITFEDPRHGHAFLQSVAERLRYLERRQVQKEREAAHEISEVKRVADFELALAKQRTEMVIEQKNCQIQEFRLQLDQLLATLALLQSHA